LEQDELSQAIVEPARPFLLRARLLSAVITETDRRPFDVEVITCLLDAVDEVAAQGRRMRSAGSISAG
jgi:hypothetical protein